MNRGRTSLVPDNNSTPSAAPMRRFGRFELRALLHEYRVKCEAVIARYEGQGARYMGDGILAYFGWPKAHEDDAERAVRAALEIVSEGLIHADTVIEFVLNVVE